MLFVTQQVTIIARGTLRSYYNELKTMRTLQTLVLYIFSVCLLLYAEVKDNCITMLLQNVLLISFDTAQKFSTLFLSFCSAISFLATAFIGVTGAIKTIKELRKKRKK